MDTLHRWWGKIKCWSGFHDPGPPQLVRLEINPDRVVLERVNCTRCGQILDVRAVGRLRELKP